MQNTDDQRIGRRERKHEQTANHLALFEAQGYEAVTMEQIAEQADDAKGTLYKHFPVKEALLAHQFRLEIAGGMLQIQDTLKRQSGFRARMSALLTASAQWNRARRPYLASYLRYRMAEFGTSPRADAGRHRSGMHSIREILFRSAQQMKFVAGPVSGTDGASESVRARAGLSKCRRSARQSSKSSRKISDSTLIANRLTRLSWKAET